MRLVPNSSTLLLILLIVLVLAAANPPGPSPPVGSDPEPNTPTLITPDRPNGTALWPYTSKTRSFDRRTLGINLIVIGDTDRVRRAFKAGMTENWTERPHPAESDNDTGEILQFDSGPGGADGLINGADDRITWRDGHASTRYTYVKQAHRTGKGTWLAESYQLYDGTYLGRRYHIRAYEISTANEEWTAMQAHHEYWDWFRLRHTVTGSSSAREYVEQDFVNTPVTKPLRRVHLWNDDAPDSDGWATVIEFVAATLLVGSIRSIGQRMASRWDTSRTFHWRLSRTGPHQSALLIGSIICLYLGVRLAGIGLERSISGVTPKIFVAVLYPLLVGGLPVAVGILSRSVPMEEAFLFTSVGLAGAFLVDAIYLSLVTIPISLLLLRVALILSLGLIAAGSSYAAQDGSRWNELIRTGVVGWVVSLVIPLAGIV